MVAKADNNQIINKPKEIYLLQLKKEICGFLFINTATNNNRIMEH